MVTYALPEINNYTTQLTAVRASFLNPQFPALNSKVSIAEFLYIDEMVKKIINEPLSVQHKAKRVENFNHSNDSSHSNVELFEGPLVELDLATTYKTESQGASMSIPVSELLDETLQFSDSD